MGAAFYAMYLALPKHISRKGFSLEVKENGLVSGGIFYEWGKFGSFKAVYPGISLHMKMPFPWSWYWYDYKIDDRAKFDSTVSQISKHLHKNDVK